MITDRRRQLRGIAFLCVGVLVFSLQDVVIKRVSGDYPLHEVMIVRSLAATPCLLLIVHLEAGLRALWTPAIGMILVRGFLLIFSYMMYYLAFPAMPLAAAVALWFTAPLAIAGLAGLMLGERVGLGRWIAIGVGFMGVLVILRPGAGVLEWAATLPLIASLSYAFGQVITRRLAPSQPASVLSFYQNIMFFTGACITAALFFDSAWATSSHPSLAFVARPWVVPTWLDLGLLTLCGPIAACGVYCLTNAYRTAEAGVVAPFEYTGMIWASAWGFLFWGEVPGLYTIAGVAILLGAGIYVMRSRDPA